MSLEYIPLGEVADITKLAGFEFTKYITYLDYGEIIALRALNLRNGSLNLSDVKYISKDVSESLPRSKLYKNDILLTYTGNGYGDCAIVEENDKYHLAPNIAKISPKKINPYFLFEFINSKYFKKQMRNFIGGSSQPTIPMKTLRILEVPFPEEEIQNKIAIILSNINKKITINKEINKNLHNIVDVIFKNFVNNYEDLDIVILSDNTNKIIRGFNSKYVDKSNLINLNQKVNKGIILEKEHCKYLNEDIDIPNEKFARKRDILLNSLGQGTLGRVHYYNEETDNVVIDQHITIIRANEELIPSTYIYEYLKNVAGQYQLDSLISGSTGMLMLNISDIRNLKIPILSKDKMKEFNSIVSPIFDKITINFEEIERLSKLRDTLLPKLMSGEIDVSEINCD
ncbi:restriction endonuclease subunit S [uncultured Methanobrevibacter sp.]|uniref:restriction endonuclease subunit S n=1 Tax=uncultured Methanobrevibacter sp. TaxID=253161 RepID=UPI0025EBE990|nr:restriction endonuclease subunit S [uncultured Methanobrevibacter sp.]